MGLACDVVHLLDVLEIETCTLVGHDWGGFMSWMTAIRAPERIDRLVVMSINNPWELPPPTPKLVAMAAAYQVPLSQPLLRTSVHPAVVRMVLKRGVAREHRWTDEEVGLYAGQYRRAGHAAAASSLYRTFITRELPALRGRGYANRRVDVPVTLAAGGADGFTGPDTVFRGVERHTSDLTTHVIDGAGHFVVDEKPREVTDIIMGA